MSTSSASVLIQRPVEEIFSFISDYHNDWKWRSRRIDFQKLNDTDPAEIMIFQKYFPLLNNKINGNYQLINYSKNECIISRIQFGKIQVIDKRNVRSLETNLTRMEFSLEINLAGLLKLFDLLLGCSLYYYLIEDLQWLKEMMEKLIIPSTPQNKPALKAADKSDHSRFLEFT